MCPQCHVKGPLSLSSGVPIVLFLTNCFMFLPEFFTVILCAVCQYFDFTGSVRAMLLVSDVCFFMRYRTFTLADTGCYGWGLAALTGSANPLNRDVADSRASASSPRVYTPPDRHPAPRSSPCVIARSPVPCPLSLRVTVSFSKSRLVFQVSSRFGVPVIPSFQFICHHHCVLCPRDANQTR